MGAPVPFKIDIPQSAIDAILTKVRAYEWHEMPEIAPGADRWAYGTDMEYMKELCSYWTSSIGFLSSRRRSTARKYTSSM